MPGRRHGGDGRGDRDSSGDRGDRNGDGDGDRSGSGSGSGSGSNAKARAAARRLLLAAAAALIPACSTYVDQRVEGVLIEALPRVVGPADRYAVDVSGANADATRLERVHAVGYRVARPDTPVLDRIDVDLRDVSVDRAQKQLTAIGAAHARVRVRADDLSAYLKGRGWVADAAVRFVAPNAVVVSGRPQIPGLPLLLTSVVEFGGRLVPDGPQLRLTVDRLQVAGFAAPAVARALIEQTINPIFDVSAYAVPSQIDAVSVDGEALLIDASGSELGPTVRSKP